MEFDIINRYFRSRARNGKDVILGIGDDCALLAPPLDQILAMSIDTLVANVHYDLDAHPVSIGHKSLAVSLSDLAAMGALPAWVMLALNLDQIDEDWLSGFCQGFFDLMERYQVSLIGGNMSSGFPSITTQITGFLPKGKGLRRGGAQLGDHIFVTGHLGEAALGLYLRKAYPHIDHSPSVLALQKALDFPSPRVEVGLAIRDIASAAIDVSDGLMADLTHILQQSNVGAKIHVEKMRLSSAIQEVMQSVPDLSLEKIMHFVLSGGDDYELCFTVPPEHTVKLQQLCASLGCACTCIGMIEAELGLRVMHHGEPFYVQSTGYQHFRRDTNE